MASAKQQLTTVLCPGCGAQYEFPSSMAGRRGRCASCGAFFTVPASRSAVPEQTANVMASRGTIFDDEERESPPQYIAVECHVCQTRMYGQPDQIGKELKCPDCGARTKVPPPPKKKPKKIPAALEGEQYELYDADVQPLPSALIAAQPKYVAVKCRQCDTVMYPTEQQVGQTITCPDCGKKHKVPPPPRQKSARSVFASAAETPRLDPDFAPVERPPAVAPETLQRIEAELDDTPYGRALAESRRTGRPLTVDSRGRPILPRWPLVTGVLPFMLSRGVPVRWLGLSLGLGFSIATLLLGLEMAMGGGAMAGMCIFALGCVLTMVSASVTASSVLTIISESSEGNKQVESWPFFLDWFGDVVLFVVAGMVSAFPGWLVSRFVPGQLEYLVISIASSMVVFFPIILLSQLDVGSMWAVLSPKLLWSMVRCPFSWLTLYIETIVITSVCLAAATVGTLWLMIPVAVAGLILYARLLGRLGWRLAEAR